MNTACKWLERSKKTKRDLLRLLKEADAYDSTGLPGWTSFFKEGHLRLGSTYLVDLGKQLSLDGLVNVAVERLRDEIQGKEQAGIAKWSQRALLKCLASVFMTVGAYEDVEDALRQAGTVWQSSRRHFRPFYTDQINVRLAIALNAQGKGDEAIKTLKTLRFLLRNPNGKEPFWLLKSFPNNRNPKARRALASMLLQNGRLDEVLKLDLAADAKDALKIFASDQYSIRTILDNLARLGNALFANDRFDEAVEIHRQSYKFWLDLADSFSIETYNAQHNLALALSHGAIKDVDEAMILLDDILIAQESPKDWNPGATRYTRAYCLARKGSISLAIQEIRTVLSTWDESNLVNPPLALGWMVKLGGSLCMENESSLRLPVWMQTELLTQCEKEPDPSIKFSIVSLIMALHRRGDIDRAIARTKDLLSLQSRFTSSIVESVSLTRTILIILLSHKGLAFEDYTLLDDALRESQTMLQAIEESPDLEAEQKARAASTLASVYSKRTSLLYHPRFGFAEADKPLLKKAIAVHRWAMQLCEATFGWDHHETRSVATTLASNLSRHGLHMGFESQTHEAEQLLSRVVESTSKIDGIDSLSDRCMKVRYNRMLHQHAKINDERLEGSEEDFLLWLTNTFDPRHPLVISQGLRMVPIFAKSRRYAEARIIADEVSNSCGALYGDTLPQTLDAYMITGWEYWRCCSFAYYPFSSLVLRRAAQHPGAEGGCSHRLINYQLMMIEARVLALSPPSEETLENATKLLQLQIDRFGRAHTTTFDLMYSIAALCLKFGLRDMAAHWLRERLAQSVLLLGITSRYVKLAWLQLLESSGASQEHQDRTREQMRQRIIAMQSTLPMSADDRSDHLADVVELATMLCLGSQILRQEHVFIVRIKERYAERLLESDICDVQSEVERVVDFSQADFEVEV